MRVDSTKPGPEGDCVDSPRVFARGKGSFRGFMMFINGRFEVSKVPCIFTSVGCVLPGSDASPHASFTSCVAPRSFDAATLSIKLTCYNTCSHRPRLHSVSPPLLRIKAVEILGTLFGRQAQQQQQSSKVQLSQCWLTCSLRCLHLREDFRFLAVVLCSRSSNPCSTRE